MNCSTVWNNSNAMLETKRTKSQHRSCTLGLARILRPVNSARTNGMMLGIKNRKSIILSEAFPCNHKMWVTKRKSATHLDNNGAEFFA